MSNTIDFKTAEAMLLEGGWKQGTVFVGDSLTEISFSRPDYYSMNWVSLRRATGQGHKNPVVRAELDRVFQEHNWAAMEKSGSPVFKIYVETMNLCS
jgi:hypothetical protein